MQDNWAARRSMCSKRSRCRPTVCCGGIRKSFARRTLPRNRERKSPLRCSSRTCVARAAGLRSSTASTASAAIDVRSFDPRFGTLRVSPLRDSTMTTTALMRFPEMSFRWTGVWRRNLLVWKKLAVASVLGNIADPLLYMLALGYGIGAFIPEVGGMKYIAFIGTGMVCQSAMFTSSFEAMYSAFSRMHMQKTWEAIINAPLSLDDVVFAEWIWAASKAVVSTTAILLVIMGLGFGHSWLALWIVPLGFLVGLAFGAFGLVMNSLAP